MQTYYEKNKDKLKVYYKKYYEERREEILDKAHKTYFNTKKKTAKCKMCGKELPKEVSALVKYCTKCLYSKGHGPDAHRMAAVRWFRKKTLDKKEGKK